MHHCTEICYLVKIGPFSGLRMPSVNPHKFEERMIALHVPLLWLICGAFVEGHSASLA